MAKMRAAIRKVAQVTPPPSPKNGDDVKGQSEWSSRLRNHSTLIANKRFKGSRTRKLVTIKKSSPVLNGENLHDSRSSTPSPVCENIRSRTRQASGENQLHCWPRRSARLVGIPAEVEDDQLNKSNSSSKSEEKYEPKVNEPQSPPPTRRRRTSEMNGTSTPVTEQPTNEDQCKNCRHRKTKARVIAGQLAESERYLHYPSKTTNGCVDRHTFNNHEIRPPHESSPSPEPRPVIPAGVEQVQFSFELVPSGTCWYQTFLRDEAQSTNPVPDEPLTSNAPFLLPYEMTLEAILKSNRAVRKTKTGRPKGAKKSVNNQSFRPIISTRLQMQSAARLAAAEAVTEAKVETGSGSESSDAKSSSRKYSKDRKRFWCMPRKSPRCHASTLAILCSKSSEPSSLDAVPEVNEPSSTEALAETNCSASEEESLPISQESNDNHVESSKPSRDLDGDLMQALQSMLKLDLEKHPEQQPAVRKRGRPRKKHRVTKAVEASEFSSLAELLATPLERIQDMVDERIVSEPGSLQLQEDSIYPIDWASRPDRCSPELPDVFHDLDSNSGGSRSSSVYETASEIESTSTGTSDSVRRKTWRANRRKRRNMTGWPRSKKRKPVPLLIDLDNENLCSLSCDDGPPSLSPIREEANLSDAMTDGEGPDVPPPPVTPLQQQQSPSSRSNYVSKPFQFQRKTLRFVGKRILRPAAQRHAPQRLEYWPCFTVTSSSPPRPRPLPKRRRCK